MINEWIKHISEQSNLIDTLLLQSNDYHVLNSKEKDIQIRKMFMVAPADRCKIEMNLNILATRIPDVEKGINVLNKTNAGAFFWEDDQNIAEFTIALIESHILARNLINDLGADTAMKIQFYYVVQIFKKYHNISKRVALDKYANIFISVMFRELKKPLYKLSTNILEENFKNFTFKYYK